MGKWFYENSFAGLFNGDIGAHVIEELTLGARCFTASVGRPT